MHNEIPFGKQNKIQSENIENTSGTREKPLAAIVITLLTIAIVLMAYRLMQNQIQIRDLKNNSVSEETGIFSISEQISPRKYIDPDGLYAFEYPSTWEIIVVIPNEYNYIEGYSNSTDVEKWLKGKMFVSNCAGPILINRQDSNQLIVFDSVSNADENESYCWSSGYLMTNDKWKVSAGYKFPLGGNVEIVPDWKGDYLKIAEIYQDDEMNVSVALINYETYKLTGEDVFNSILDKFAVKDEETGTFSFDNDASELEIDLNSLQFDYSEEYYSTKRSNSQGSNSISFEKIDKPGNMIQIIDLENLEGYDPNKSIPELLNYEGIVQGSNLRSVSILGKEFIFTKHLINLENELKGLCEYGGSIENNYIRLSDKIGLIVNTPTETKVCGETETTKYKYDVEEIEDALNIVESISQK